MNLVKRILLIMCLVTLGIGVATAKGKHDEYAQIRNRVSKQLGKKSLRLNRHRYLACIRSRHRRWSFI